MARSYRSLREALDSGRGIERPFNCPVHPDAHASASVNVLKGVWHCLPASTRVLTDDLRWVPIGTVSPGMRLAGFDEHGDQSYKNKRRWRVAVVEDCAEVMRTTFAITLADSRVIEASSDHQWLCRTSQGIRWIRTKDLVNRNGNGVEIISLCDPWEYQPDYSAGYLAAAFDGEGSLCRWTKGHHEDRTALAFYQASESVMLEVFVRHMAAKGLDLRHYRHYQRLTDRREHHRPMSVLKSTDRRNILSVLGTVRPPRLLSQFDFERYGYISTKMGIRVTKLELLGTNPVMAVQTSTGTYVAEGLASHNCYSCHASGKTADGTHDLNYIPLLRDARIPEMPVAAVHLTNAYLGYSPYWAARYGVEVATWFNTGTDPVTGMPTIPITDRLGTTLHGFLLRNGAAAPDEPKYRYPVGVPVSRLLFGHHLVPARCELLMLVEGASDVLGLYRWLLPPDVAVIAVFGAGLHAAQAVMVRDLAPHRVVVAMDADDPGRKANQRSADHLDDLGVRATIHDWSVHDVSDPGSLQENPWPTIVST